MKVFPFKIPKTGNASLLFQVDEEYAFYDKLHQHEEFQITYIERGEGSVLIGDSIHAYKAGDVFLIGSNLPHVFVSSNDYTEKSLMKTIFFTQELFGKDFLSIAEFDELFGIVEDSKAGIQFLTNQHQMTEKILDFGAEKGLNRIILFFELLRLIKNSSYKKLSTFVYTKEYTELEGKRMSNIMNYTIANFSKNITLEAVAEKANMNKNAFCRYFKQRTNKSYFQFLIEVRIENACKDLVQYRDLTIVEVAERCGFQNISNFNRKFREIKNTTPYNYRKQQGVLLKNNMQYDTELV